MKQIRILSIIALMLFGIGSTNIGAQIVVKVRPKAPSKVVVKTKAPGKNYIFINGHWSVKNNKYIWIEGHWVKKRKGAVYVSGHWKKVRGGYKWIPGHWKKRGR